MYWIFLVIFLVIVLVPEFINRDFFSLGQDRLESLVIFTLGVMGFIVYLFTEKEVRLYKGRTQKAMRDFRKTSDDLVTTYGYIGELNRKMEVLKGMADILPDRSYITEKDAKEMDYEILEYINLIVKCTESSVRIIDTKSLKTLKEITLGGTTSSVAENKKLAAMDNMTFSRENGLVTIASSKIIDSVRSYAIIKQCPDDLEKRPDDIEMVKTLLSHVLLFYFYIGNQKKKHT